MLGQIVDKSTLTFGLGCLANAETAPELASGQPQEAKRSPVMITGRITMSVRSGATMPVTNPIKRRLIIGSMLSAVILTGCRVSQSDFAALTATNQQLLTQNAQLRTQNQHSQKAPEQSQLGQNQPPPSRLTCRLVQVGTT